MEEECLMVSKGTPDERRNSEWRQAMHREAGVEEETEISQKHSQTKSISSLKDETRTQREVQWEVHNYINNVSLLLHNGGDECRR